MNVKLIIFDLDGTLLDTIDDLATSVNYALQQNGYPTHELSAFRYFIGNGVNKLIERALPEESRSEAMIMRVRHDFKTHYAQHNTDLTKPYPGIEALLEELQRRRIRLAVASNKYQSATVKLVEHYFPAEMFSVVLGQRDGCDPKPDPTIVLDILSETGFAPSETLYIGDSKVDMQTAANSDLYSVGVTWGFRPRTELEEHGAKSIIDTPQELLDVLSLCERP